MLTDSDTFYKYYHEASEEIQVLLDSSRLPDFSKKVVVDLDLPAEKAPAITRIMNRLVVGLITQQEVPEYLGSEVGVPEDKIQITAAQIKTFISHVMPHQTEQAQTVDTTSKPIERTPATPLESRERLHLRPEAQTAAEAAGWGTAPSVAPMTREKIAESLAPKRTMASDIAAAKGTQSGAPVPTQNPSGEVPRYAKPLTDTR